MQNQPIVMIVDDNTTNLKIGRKVLGERYNVFSLPSGEKLFQLMERILPDIILLDIEMPDMDGYDVIKRLKMDFRTVSVPVIFLTAKDDTGSELEGLTLGAVDYIVKPFSPPILLKRVETHLLLKKYSDNLLGMVEEKTRAVVELQNAVLTTLSELVECRDDATGGHIVRTKKYLQILVDELVKQGKYEDVTSKWDFEFFFDSALLHDVGKISIRDNILLKPGKLTDEEYDMMKEHTVQGVKIIEKIEEHTSEHNFLYHAKIFAGMHHERWDGKGYPYGLREFDIPLQARLMAVADVYDALISQRPYKNALSHNEAVEIIKEGSGTQFDPVLVKLFIKRADEFYKIAQGSLL